MEGKGGDTDELLDVRGAATLLGRHPETVRRWVWSGRLRARRKGSRLLLERRDVEALAAAGGRPAVSLAAWARRAQAAMEQAADGGLARSAADLVIEDRERRAEAPAVRASR